MKKQTKSKKSENVGKGKVTPVQIAFIVDRYLLDNNYTHTRSTFRTEASHLISKSPVHEAPKSLLSLGAILDDYICLKEQRVMMDQEKCFLQQEKLKVQNLLKGMQDVMNVYNASAPLPPMITSTAPKLLAMVPQIDIPTGSPSGHPVYNTPVVMSTLKPSNNTLTDPKNFSTPSTVYPTSKRRKYSKDVSDVPITAKRPRTDSSANQLRVKGTEALPQSNNGSNNREVQASAHVRVNNGSPNKGSSVAKCLFNQPNQSPTISSGPKTPPRATASQTEKSVSPPEISTASTSNNVTPQRITSTNRTVITSETIRVSPAKQISYYSIERNHCISTSPIKSNLGRFKRDHVKGRLDFDSSEPIPCGISASESEKEGDIFDLDFPNLDALGVDFSLSELLLDFDFDGEGMNYSCQPAVDSAPDSLSGSPHTSGNVCMGADQLLSEISSTLTEILSDKDMNTPGPGSATSMKSTTKCIKILSPVKNRRSTLDQENLSAIN